MSDRLYCPVCNFDSSTVLSHVAEGRPCPYCATPPELILQINSLRERRADEKLVQQIQNQGVRIAQLEREKQHLRRFIQDIRDAIEQADEALHPAQEQQT